MAIFSAGWAGMRLGCSARRSRRGATGLVAVQRIPFSSLCEHHLVPFYGSMDIVYLPHAGRVAGVSRFVEAVDVLARRPQLQERLTREVAEAVMRGLSAEGALVVCRAHQ